jgi:hypothetical protein
VARALKKFGIVGQESRAQLRANARTSLRFDRRQPENSRLARAAPIYNKYSAKPFKSYEGLKLPTFGAEAQRNSPITSRILVLQQVLA